MHALLMLTAALLTGQTPGTQAEFERLAQQIKFFPTHHFVFDRNTRLDVERKIDKDWEQAWLKTFQAISTRKHALAELIQLLKHEDARVRTLALAALFQREDPRLLPHFAGLLGDKAKTVPGLPALDNSAKKATNLPLQPKEPPPYQPADFTPQTVGEVAEAMLEFWLAEAGKRTRDFDAYWALRKDRKFCASWFLVRMRRIQRSNVEFCGFDEKERPRVQAIRKEIDALPPLERAWTLLYVGISGQFCGKLGSAFGSRAEYVAAAKRLGPERLLDLIFDRSVSDDPDLKEKDWDLPGRYAIGWWVIGNAKTLLRATDAPALLEAERTTRHRSPACVIAACELQPANSRKWLREAFRRYDERGYWHIACDRAALSAALWRLVGESELDFLADWFYSEKIDAQPHTTPTEVFLNYVKGVRAPADRKLVARLIDDPRFDKLDHQTVRALVFVVNGWTKMPVVGERALYVNWERGGWTPETPKDLQIVATWRKRLKESRAQWQR